MKKEVMMKMISGVLLSLFILAIVDESRALLDPNEGYIRFFTEPLPEYICDGKKELKLDFSKTVFHAEVKVVGPVVPVKELLRKVEVQVIKVLRGVSSAESFPLYFGNISSAVLDAQKISKGEVFYIIGKVTNGVIGAYPLTVSQWRSTMDGGCVEEKSWFSKWLSDWFPASE